MFDFLKKKKAETFVLGAPVKGTAVSLEKVNDPTFRDGLLGKGMAVIPTEGRIYAPSDGEIGMVFETLHALSMTSESGAEILIHVGLDTVKMKGEGFSAHVQAGDKVRKGELLLEMDLERIRLAGYDTITPVLVCNTDAFAEIEEIFGGEVLPGDDILRIKKK